MMPAECLREGPVLEYFKIFLSEAVTAENNVQPSLRVLENSIEEFEDFTFVWVPFPRFFCSFQGIL